MLGRSKTRATDCVSKFRSRKSGPRGPLFSFSGRHGVALHQRAAMQPSAPTGAKLVPSCESHSFHIRERARLLTGSHGGCAMTVTAPGCERQGKRKPPLTVVPGAGSARCPEPDRRRCELQARVEGVNQSLTQEPDRRRCELQARIEGVSQAYTQLDRCAADTDGAARGNVCQVRDRTARPPSWTAAAIPLQMPRQAAPGTPRRRATLRHGISSPLKGCPPHGQRPTREDGVAHAYAPSSKSGPSTQISVCQVRSLSAARSELVHPPLAPQTFAPPK